MRDRYLGCLVLLTVMAVFTGVSHATLGGKSWTKSYDGYSTLLLPIAPQVAIDSQGNRIVAYTAYTLASGSMSESHWHVVSYNKEGEINWEKDITGARGFCFVTALAVGGSDEVVVGGTEYNSAGDVDWKVVKFSSSGSQLATYSYDGGNGDDWLGDVGVDSKGNIVGVGTSEGSSGYSDWRVVFFLSSGTRTYWISSSVGGCLAYRVAVDSKDNAVVAGYTTDNSRGDIDWRVVSYAHGGSGINWQKTFDSGHGNDYAYDVEVDDSGNVAVAGRIRDSSGSSYDWKVSYYQVSGSTATLKWSDEVDGEGGYDAAFSVAFDGSGNVVAGGYTTKGGDHDWLLVSYKASTGVRNWSETFDSTEGNDEIQGIGVSNGIVVAAGYTSNGGDVDWRVRAYSASDGSALWDDVYSERDDDFAWKVAMDSDGGACVCGVSSTVSSIEFNKVRVVDYAGEESGGGTGGGDGGNGTGGGSLLGHALEPSEVRTVNTPPATPDPVGGEYLGFGSAAIGGTEFKLQASFPQYVNPSKTLALDVKIFIAAQLPDDYSRLLYITSANEIKYQPPNSLSSWKPKVKGMVPNTTVLNTSTASMPTGTHYWYTLVVPSTVPDDFSGVDWSVTPWEVTINVLDLH